jgi:quinol-cytochrome oxidoreductase complex cytochrome b subunit
MAQENPSKFSLWKERLLYTGAAPDDRGRMVAVLNNVILHLHPTTLPASALRFTYTWGLGGVSAVLAVMLAATGMLLMFRYDASVERAYMSIQMIESEVAFGSLVRAIHHWSANLLVITTFLHLARVFFTGGYKKGRTVNWVVGMALLVIVLAFNFTGYLLPWDQLAYWAITVSTTLLDYIPVIGATVSRFVLGGPEVGQGALRNFYAIHVAVLPLLLALTMAYHFWKIRKNGGLSQPEVESRPERVTTIPNLVQRELAVALAVVVAILIFSTFVPAPLGGLANPARSPNPAKAAWYFLGLQELLLHMHSLAAILLVGLGLVVLTLMPGLDRREEDIGVYFRSGAGKRAALLGAFLSLDLTPLLVIADEYWIDLPNALPGLPATISNGLLPLGLTLLGLAGIYTLLRLLVKHQGARANHSEALVGMFTFVMVSLILLTAVGVYFRGENMVLELPF